MGFRAMQRLVFLGVISISLLGCASPTKQDNNGETKTLFQPEFASFFKVVSHGKDSVLVLLHPSNQLDNDSISLSKTYDIACLSATHSAFISELKASNQIKAIDDCAFHAHEAIKKRCEKNDIYVFGETSGLHPERIIESKVNLISISGFDNKPSWSASVEKLGVSCCRIWEWKEKSPLAKAEWIIAFGYLTGKSALAKEIFAKELRQYKELQQNKSKGLKSFSGNSYQGVWYCPGSSSYMAKLMEDAGLEYILNYPGFGSASIQNEEAIMALNKSDIWIYHGSCRSVSCLLKEDNRLSFSGEVLKNIWAPWKNVEKNGANPFWDYGAVYPSMILEDYINISHNNTEQLNFYVKLP